MGQTNQSTDNASDEIWTTKAIGIVVVLIIGTILIAWFAVYLFTLNHSTFLDLSKEDTAWIGDTIGGITSPIIGILGSLLVYVSFKEQFEANRIQRKALEDAALRDSIMASFNYLREELKDFSFTYSTDGGQRKTEKGSSAFFLVGDMIKKGKQNKIYGQKANNAKIAHIFSTAIYLANKIENLPVKSSEIKELEAMFKFYSSAKIEPTAEVFENVTRGENQPMAKLATILKSHLKSL
jgi:hypothetical protein